MGRWARPNSRSLVPPVVSPWFEAYKVGIQTAASSNTQNNNQANQIHYWPLYYDDAWMATKLWWQNGSTVSGNIDVGIYDAVGNRLISTGSTAQTGTSSIQSVDIADTPIPAGLIYMAWVLNNTSGFFFATATATSPRGETIGFYQQLSTFPLPATATFAPVGGGTAAILIKFGALKWPRTVL